MAVADRATTFSLFFRNHFFARFLERGWLASPDGRGLCCSGRRPSVRLSARTAAYWRVSLRISASFVAAGQVINVHLPSLTSPLRLPVVAGTGPALRRHPDELLTSSTAAAAAEGGAVTSGQTDDASI